MHFSMIGASLVLPATLIATLALKDSSGIIRPTKVQVTALPDVVHLKPAMLITEWTEVGLICDNPKHITGEEKHYLMLKGEDTVFSAICYMNQGLTNPIPVSKYEHKNYVVAYNITKGTVDANADKVYAEALIAYNDDLKNANEVYDAADKVYDAEVADAPSLYSNLETGKIALPIFSLLSILILLLYGNFIYLPQRTRKAANEKHAEVLGKIEGTKVDVDKDVLIKKIRINALQLKINNGSITDKEIKELEKLVK